MTRDLHKVEGGLGDHALSTGMTALLVAGLQDSHNLADDPFIDAGLQVLRAIGLEAADAAFAQSAPGVVFLPLAVDGQSTRALLDRILSARPQPMVVVIAANDQINAAAEAMRVGAFDCLFRPFSTQRLARTVDAAIAALPPGRRPVPRAGNPGAPEQTPIMRAPDVPPAPRPLRPASDRFVSNTPQMRAVRELVAALAQSEAPVFLSGELGTGKALVARLLHDKSARAAGAFVAVNCPGLTPQRIDAVLAGPEGALARGATGTVYFDEICELDPRVQPELLHLIDSARPSTGSTGLRLVASTRHDPHAAMRSGRLRSDLFYRLHVAPIALPPLRARRADIAAIARANLATFSHSEGRSFTGCSDSAMAMLESYDWPGNVRELLNVIWSVVLLHDGPLVTPQMLPPEIAAPRRRAPAAAPVAAESLVGKTLDEIEQAVIEATIVAEGGSVPRAARVLDVSPSTIYRKREAWATRGRG